jgi:hypothetical protein
VTDDLAAQIALLGVDDVLGGAASALASVAYAKLGAGDLQQAKRAIDALATILPLLEDEGLQRDLGAALANLQVGYAAKV